MAGTGSASLDSAAQLKRRRSCVHPVLPCAAQGSFFFCRCAHAPSTESSKQGGRLFRELGKRFLAEARCASRGGFHMNAGDHASRYGLISAHVTDEQIRTTFLSSRLCARCSV